MGIIADHRSGLMEGTLFVQPQSPWPARLIRAMVWSVVTAIWLVELLVSGMLLTGERPSDLKVAGLTASMMLGAGLLSVLVDCLLAKAGR